MVKTYIYLIWASDLPPFGDSSWPVESYTNKNTAQNRAKELNEISNDVFYEVKQMELSYD